MGETCRLLAKDQVIAAPEVGIENDAARLGGDEPHARGLRGGEIAVPGLMVTHIQPRPVVKTRATTGLLGGVKAQRVNQVQRAAGRDAGAADVARVVGDFGFMQNHMKHRRARCRASFRGL